MIQPFQEIIGHRVLRFAADVEKEGLSFALADGIWVHYQLLPGIKLEHALNVANLQDAEILGVQAVSGEGDGLVETVVNIDVKDQPEVVLRLEVTGKRREAAALGQLVLVRELMHPVGDLHPFTEDF